MNAAFCATLPFLVEACVGLSSVLVLEVVAVPQFKEQDDAMRWSQA